MDLFTTNPVKICIRNKFQPEKIPVSKKILF